VLAAVGPARGGKGSGEQPLARRLYPRLQEDWLLIADRNFYAWQDWCTAAGTGAALLWRAKSGLPRMVGYAPDPGRVHDRCRRHPDRGPRRPRPR
jgi:hypothetical protein